MQDSVGLKLTLIPAGEFTMGGEGTPEAVFKMFPHVERRWLDAEAPRHVVRITKPFYMGKYEVTLGQYKMFLSDSHYQLDAQRDGRPNWGYDAQGNARMSTTFGPLNTGWPQAADHPVVYVSWNDAVAFCKWLSKKEHATYRLPTEAEWEYTCRAGSSTRYSFGDDPEQLPRFANAADRAFQDKLPNAFLHFQKRANNPSRTIPFPFLERSDNYSWTAPVGSFGPNTFGVHDMHGNVSEWCSDWYSDGYYESSPAENPLGPKTGTARVVRGGSFYLPAVKLRSAYRDLAAPSFSVFYYGFRVLREP